MVTTSLPSKETIIVNGDKSHPRTEITEETIEEPTFSDPEGFVDQYDESELLEDILRVKPNEEEILDKVVVVDNIPEVEVDRLPKLKVVILAPFKRIKGATVLSEHFPVGPNPAKNGIVTTKGYCFVELDSKSNAKTAVETYNGHNLDKTHKLFMTTFRDFDKLRKTENPEDWEEPKLRPYKDRGNLRYWLQNPDCLDQFAVQYENGDKVAVFLNGLTEPSKLTERQHWSDTFIRWSPYGTFLATVHKQGIILWGGDKFEQINKFGHNGVQYLDFSPAEKFIVTCAPPRSKYADLPDAIKIWCIRTGELKYSSSAQMDTKWPKFKWSFDDSHVAVLDKDNTLCIYETNKFTPVKSEAAADQKITNVRDFQWSPSEAKIAFWVREVNQTPGRVGVCDSRAVLLATKNLFSLADATIHWQKSGDHVCFKTELYKKKKMGEDGEFKYSNVTVQLEVFHIREKNIPLSTLEIKEPVHAFSWEPVGNKFALIQSDIKSMVHIYGAMKNENVPSITHLKMLDHKGQVNSLFWSPHGNYLVCAGIKSNSAGTLMFVDCSLANEITLMNTQEHPAVTDIEWDPTGRYVISSISAWTASSRAMDFGYLVFNFQGRMLARRQLQGFCAFSWRPRPPTLLTDEATKAIKKNMKKYAAEFDEKDRKKLDKASQEVADRRRKQLADFKNWRQQHKEFAAEYKDDQAKLRKESQESQETSEETVEYLIHQEETVLE